MPKATARSNGDGLSHFVKMRGHSLVADEPRDQGGDDTGPTPQDLLAVLQAGQNLALEVDASSEVGLVAPSQAGLDASPPSTNRPSAGHRRGSGWSSGFPTESTRSSASGWR